MNNNPHNLEVGQKLFRVTTVNRSRYGSNESWETVAKIGRKWATLEGEYHPERIDLQSLRVDGAGYSSPGQCYLTEEEYREGVEKNMIWEIIRRHVSNNRPSKPSLPMITQAAELLGINPSPETDDE